jgi:hypothetical protein
MHQTADSSDVANFVQFVLKNTANEDVTGKKRLHYPHDTPSSRPLHAQTGVKNLQTQIFTNVGRRNMLVLRLGPGAIPFWICDLHQLEAQTIIT